MVSATSSHPLMATTSRAVVASVGLVLGSVSLVAIHAAETDRARRLDEQREDAAVRKAHKELSDAQQEAREAQQSLQKSQGALRKAEAERKAAGAGVQKMIDRLEVDHAESAGLNAARNDLKECRTALKEAAEPILGVVRQGSAYRAAEKELATATAALEPEAEGDREEAVRKAAAARATMRDLARSATDADPRLRPLEAKVGAAEERFAAAQARFEKAVEKDAGLKSARDAFAAAQSAEDRAEAALVRDNRGLLAARSRLLRAQQSLQAKKLADQRDDNKPPKKKPK